ncbi:DUF3422 domain-containing protein [Erythrobacteraceae bacterium E2-1 Yellow Sea]|nr:DUF3422 domain-containing protein [Erythrobacteraceae bacterium E2-1 Yellow Sea]
MREHPFRRQVVEEMHLRRWPELPASGIILQIIRTVQPSDRADELSLLRRIINDPDRPISPADRHIAGKLPSGIQYIWERHTEGSSIAVIAEAGKSATELEKAREWIESFPGDAVRASKIYLAHNDEAAADMMHAMPFTQGEIVSSRLIGGVRFWSDFRIHSQGYGCVLVAANSCGSDMLSRIVQQLQELGNYRNMALLALPLVREQWLELDKVERQRRLFAAEVSDPATKDDALLEKVSSLSLELANLSNCISYRLDATKAYAELVNERLEGLQPEIIEGTLSLRGFTKRRFLPAVRTCAAHHDRLQRLSGRAANMTALLRARIETRIENQNARLLKSMESRAKAQLRLQQVVEGLSIFALTYYSIGLLSYILHGAEEVVHLPHSGLLLAIAVPFVMLGIWLAIHRIKKRILGQS